MKSPTKKYKTLMWIFKALALLATFGPLLFFLIYGFCTGSVKEKLTMSMLSAVGALLAVISIITKRSPRTAIYLLLIAVSVVLDDVMPALITMCVCAAADDYAFSPLAKHFKDKFIINKEIDQRIETK